MTIEQRILNTDLKLQQYRFKNQDRFNVRNILNKSYKVLNKTSNKFKHLNMNVEKKLIQYKYSDNRIDRLLSKNKAILISILLLIPAFITFNTYNNYQNTKVVLEQTTLTNQSLLSQVKSNISKTKELTEIKAKINFMTTKDEKHLEKISLEENAKIMYNELKKYKKINEIDKVEIIKTLLQVAIENNTSPMVYFNIIKNESSFNHKLTHDTRRIDINGKKVTINAVGLGGIVWEVHKDMLKKRNIAQNREDLFKIPNNIRASVAIFEDYKKMPLLAGSKNATESGLKRYFGGNHDWYAKKNQDAIAETILNDLKNASQVL